MGARSSSHASRCVFSSMPCTRPLVKAQQADLSLVSHRGQQGHSKTISFSNRVSTRLTIATVASPRNGSLHFHKSRPSSMVSTCRASMTYHAYAHCARGGGGSAPIPVTAPHQNKYKSKRRLAKNIVMRCDAVSEPDFTNVSVGEVSALHFEARNFAFPFSSKRESVHKIF